MEESYLFTPVQTFMVCAVFYAHEHPEEICQQKLTGARRASRRRRLFSTRLHPALRVEEKVMPLLGLYNKYYF